MISIIENSRIKEKCQVFTPKEQAEHMLNLADYKYNLYGKRLLENSCGNGEILSQAITRYIDDCLKNHFPTDKIKKGLEEDFAAYEIDDERIEECKSKLNRIVKSYKIEEISWDIRNKDYLSDKADEKFDFIIGNPPYIAYSDLPKTTQEFVKNNFDTCRKGKFDYSYAFIEKSYSQLKTNGNFVYIIPSNIFKNVFANELRKLIIKDIVSIDDFPEDSIFQNVLVSPAIIKIVKDSSTSSIIYRVSETEKEIIKSSLFDKWFFYDTNYCGTKIGDYYRVSSSVATLLNEAFVVKGGIMKKDFYELCDHKIERSLLRRAASPKNKRYDKKEYIIFPYYYDEDGGLHHYSEKEMYDKFPSAMNYLEEYKDKLQKRDADKNAKWFEYGRSQALHNMNQRLLLISTVISDCTQPYLLDVDEIPYSGFYIMPIGEKAIDDLLPILQSVEFKQYINSIGTCVSGSSKRISSKDLENYTYKEYSHGKNEV